MISLFNYFFEKADFDKQFSSSFIFLILKVKNPTSLNDFRPISQLGWVHKLVTRVLATRLKGVIVLIEISCGSFLVRWDSRRDGFDE